MKKIFMILLLTGVLFLLTGEAKADLNKYGGGYFNVTLSSHGHWLDLGDGMVVWKPAHVRRGWAPYSLGEWVWTDDGWYWDSYEPFGDIVYHYGRWYFDDYYGWIWVPDDQWAPAWVEWRYDDDYIGWAPLSPYASFSVNIGIHFTHDYYTPYSHWNFVSYRHFCSPGMYNNYVGSKVKYRVYNNTKYRTNYEYRGGNVYNRGIDRDYVQKRGNGNIRTRQIERVTDPGQFDRTKDRERNVVRTYVASRDDMSRENLGTTNIKRSDRKTTLDLAKVNVGRSDNTGRNTREDRNVTNSNQESRGNTRNGKESNGRESIITRDGDSRRMDSPPVNERKRDNDVRQQQELQKRQQGEVQQRQQKETEQRQQVELQKRQQVELEKRQQGELKQRQQQELQKRQQGEVQRRQQQETEKRQQGELQKRQQQETEKRQQVELQKRQQRETETRRNTERVEERKRNDAPVVRNRENTRTEERKVEQRNETRKESGNRRR